MIKTYYVDGKGYIDLDPSEVQRFLTRFPNARQRTKGQELLYNVPEKGNIKIKPEEETAFLSQFKNARPLTQKDAVADFDNVEPKLHQTGILAKVGKQNVSAVAESTLSPQELAIKSRLGYAKQDIANQKKINELRKQSLNQSEQAAIIKANPEFATSPEMQERYNRLVSQSAQTNELITTKETGMDKWERAAYQTGKDLKDSGLLGELATYPMAALAGTVELIMGIPMAASAPTKMSKTYSGIMRGLSGGMNEGDSIVENLVKGTIYSLPMLLPYSLLSKAGMVSNAGRVVGTATTMGLTANQQISQDIKDGTLDNRKLAADIISAGVQAFTETGFTEGEFTTIGKLFKAGKKEAANAYIRKIVTNAMQPKAIKTVGSVITQESGEEVAQYVQDVLAQHFIAGVPLPDKKEFAKQVALNAAGGALGGFFIGGVGSALQIVPNYKMNKYLKNSQSPMAKNINDAIKLANDGNFEAAKAMYAEAENKKTDKTNKYELRALGLLKGGLDIADKAAVIKEVVAKTEQVNSEGFASEVQRIDDLISQARNEKDTAKVNELITQATEAKDALLGSYKSDYSMKAMEQQQRIDDIVTRQKLNKKETQPVTVEPTEPVTIETTKASQPTVKDKVAVDNKNDNKPAESSQPAEQKQPKPVKKAPSIADPEPVKAVEYSISINGGRKKVDDAKPTMQDKYPAMELFIHRDSYDNGQKTTYGDWNISSNTTGGRVSTAKTLKEAKALAEKKLTSLIEKTGSQENAVAYIKERADNENALRTEKKTHEQYYADSQAIDEKYTKKSKPVKAEKTPVEKRIPEPKPEAKKTVTEGGVTISTEKQLNALAKKRGELVDQLVKAKAELKAEPKSSVQKQVVADYESEIIQIDKQMEGLKDTLKYSSTLSWLAKRGKSIRSVTKAFIKVIPRDMVKKVSYSKDRAFIDLNNGESIAIDLTTGVIEKTKSGRIEFYPVSSILALVDISKSYNAKNMVAYHEAGHLAFNIFLSQAQRDALIAEYKTEEKAMDAFAVYMADRSSFMGKVKAVFAYLRAKFMQLWNNSMSPEWAAQQNKIFADMARGKYNNSQPIQSNATKYSTITNETRARRKLSENEMKILNASDNFIKQSKDIADRVYANVRGANNQEAFAKALQNRVTYIIKKLFGGSITDVNYAERLNKLLGVTDIKNATPKQVFGFLSQYDPLMVHYMRDGLISNLMAKLAASGINWNTAFAHYKTWGDVISSMTGTEGEKPLYQYISNDLRMGIKFGEGGVNLVNKTSVAFVKYKGLTSWRTEVEASLLAVEANMPKKTLYRDYNAIIMALENRESAESIIDSYVKENNLSEVQSNALKNLYKDMLTFFDKFKTYIEAHPELKIGTLPNYFTHALLGDYNYFEDEIAVPELDANGVPLNAASAEHRKDPKAKFDPEKMKVNLRKVLDGYSYSMSKRIAYFDVVQYYKSGQFSRDAGQIMLAASPIFEVREYLNSIIHPKANTSNQAEFIRNVTSRLYIALLIGSPTFTVLNFFQRFNNLAFASMKACRLVVKNSDWWSGRLKNPNAQPKTQALLDTFNMSSTETIMKEIEQELKRLAKNDPNRKFWHRLAVWNDEKLATIAENHPGFLAEIGNWNTSFLAGVYQYVMNTQQYKDIIKDNPNKIKAIETVLQDSKIYDAAFVAGVRTCSKVNPSTNPAYTPEYFKNSANRLFVMFARFSLNLTQQTYQTITQGKKASLPATIDNIYSFGDDVSKQAGHNLQTANILLNQIKTDKFLSTYQSQHGVDLKQAKADIAEMTTMLTSMRDEIYNGLSQITPVKRWYQITNMLGYIIANAILTWFVNYLRDKQKELMGINVKPRSLAASIPLSFLGSFGVLRSMSTVQDIVNPVDNYGRVDWVKGITALMSATPGIGLVGGSINAATNLIYGETAVRWAYKRIKDELDY